MGMSFFAAFIISIASMQSGLYQANYTYSHLPIVHRADCPGGPIG